MKATSVVMTAEVSLVIDLDGPEAGSAYGRLEIEGRATIDQAALVLRFGFVPPPGTAFTILTNAFGTFAGLPEGATVTAGGHQFHVTYTAGRGRDVVLTVVDSPSWSPVAQCPDDSRSAS